MSSTATANTTITPESIREFESILNKMKAQVQQTEPTLSPTDVLMHEFVKPVKGNKNAVRRMFCFNETGTVIVDDHPIKVIRKGTIVYQYDFKNGTLTYAASIFKTPFKNQEHFDRSKHLQTAIRRFNKHPVTVENFVDEPGFKDADVTIRNEARNNFNMRIRKLLFKYGCRFSNPHSDSASQYSDDTN